MKIAGIDPALRNTGLAIGEIDTQTSKLRITELYVIKTEREESSGMSEDILRRSNHLQSEVHRLTTDCKLVFAELPTGGSNRQAAFTLGAGFVAALAGLQAPVVTVNPSEVKQAVLERLPGKLRNKKAMVDWAKLAHPEAPWPTYKREGIVYPVTDVNHLEHLADAIATIYAGLQKQRGENE